MQNTLAKLATGAHARRTSLLLVWLPIEIWWSIMPTSLSRQKYTRVANGIPRTDIHPWTQIHPECRALPSMLHPYPTATECRHRSIHEGPCSDTRERLEVAVVSVSYSHRPSGTSKYLSAASFLERPSSCIVRFHSCVTMVRVSKSTHARFR